MPIYDFYNNNAGIAYPLVESPSDFPTNLLLGASFILAPTTKYQAGVDSVSLSSVAGSPGVVTLTFTVNNGVSPAVTLSGTISGEWPAGTEFQVTSAGNDVGWVAVGSSADFAEAGPLELDSNQVEPSLVQSLYNACVSSFSIYNWDELTQQYAVVAEDITGDVVFTKGYNCYPQIDSSGTLRFIASPGAGLGCQPSWPGLTDCSGVIRSINGIKPNASGGFSIVVGNYMQALAQTHEVELVLDGSFPGAD